MDRILFLQFVKAVSERFPVNSNELFAQVRLYFRDKINEALVELLWIYCCEGPSEGIITRDSVGQFKELAQP